ADEQESETDEEGREAHCPPANEGGCRYGPNEEEEQQQREEDEVPLVPRAVSKVDRREHAAPEPPASGRLLDRREHGEDRREDACEGDKAQCGAEVVVPPRDAESECEREGGGDCLHRHHHHVDEDEGRGA